MSKIDEILKKLQGMSWEEYSLDDDLFVDKYALDVESERQPMLVAKWGMALAEAQKIRDKKKEILAKVDADLFAKGKVTKVSDKLLTDVGAKNWVKAHPDHEKAFNDLIESDLHVNYLWAAKNAIDAKGDSIRVEGRLWEKGYFSKPAVSQAGMQKSEQVQRDEALTATTENLEKRNIRKKQL